MSRIARPPGDADAVKIIEQGDGEFSGRVEQVLEFDAFQSTVLGDVGD